MRALASTPAPAQAAPAAAPDEHDEHDGGMTLAELGLWGLTAERATQGAVRYRRYRPGPQELPARPSLEVR